MLSMVARLTHSISLYLTLGFTLLLAACSSSPSHKSGEVTSGGVQRNGSIVSSPGAGAHPITPPEPSASRLTPGRWRQVPGWGADDPIPAWGAFRSSCQALANKAKWRSVCIKAKQVDPLNPVAIRHFFEDNFRPYRAENPNGTTSGTITGYYEPVLHGSLTRHGRYQTPIYTRPENVSRWRLKRPRARLLASGVLRGHELAWVDDPIEAAYLQIQGSGVIQLDNGKSLRVGFSDTNGQPFRSFARWLINHHQITYPQATLPGIRAWAQRHPEQVETALNANPRYVYFRVLGAQETDDTSGPIGALGVPLTAQRSIAVDPARIPLGAPVFLSTSHPTTGQPLRRLVMAQDTGSAIKGSVRADFFWGQGDDAGALAGSTKQRGQMWVLEPK